MVSTENLLHSLHSFLLIVDRDALTQGYFGEKEYEEKEAKCKPKSHDTSYINLLDSRVSMFWNMLDLKKKKKKIKALLAL